MTRRAFLARTGAAAVALLGAPHIGRVASALSAADDELWHAPGMPPEVTPVDAFYTVSKNLFDPRIDAAGWSLQVDGLVHRPFSVDFAALTRGGRKAEAYVTLTCISNEVGGELTGNAFWGGVPLRTLLQDAGVKEGAVDLVMEAYDGYTDSIPIAKAMHPDTLLVWEMNGEPLTASHGFPARIIVPGIYGMKNVKWIRRLTVADHDHRGYWARRGWSDTARVKTWSRIDAPHQAALQPGRPVVVGGLAYAGDRGVSSVELSVDGGATWQPAAMKEPLGPYAWRLWGTVWTPAEPGERELLVRATDGTGAVQSGVQRPPLPDGADGYHRKIVRVLG